MLSLLYILRHFEYSLGRRHFGEQLYGVVERPSSVRLTPNLASIHISYGWTWLQNHMLKLPLEPRLSRLRPRGLPDPSTSLSLTLMPTYCPYRAYASFPPQCPRYMLCWMMHHPPRLHHDILLYCTILLRDLASSLTLTSSLAHRPLSTLFKAQRLH